jgi:protein gp37
MGENSKISWTTHTFNPWRGCTKISAGCTNCYAETLSHRNPAVLGVWGDKGTRVVASDSAWREPLKWDRKARAAGERHRVFCASLADVFEDRPELVATRGRLIELIARTPNLDWLLLTKRPEGIADRLHEVVRMYHGGDHEHQRGLPTGDMIASEWLDGEPPRNVWLGTSVEDQAAADVRIPELLAIPAAVRFLSCEPLLGPVDLTLWLSPPPFPEGRYEAGPGKPVYWAGDVDEFTAAIGPVTADWVIAGAESGPGARPMDEDWVRAIRDRCIDAGTPFFYKQRIEAGRKVELPALDGKVWGELPAAAAIGGAR